MMSSTDAAVEVEGLVAVVTVEPGPRVFPGVYRFAGETDELALGAALMWLGREVGSQLARPVRVRIGADGDTGVVTVDQTGRIVSSDEGVPAPAQAVAPAAASWPPSVVVPLSPATPVRPASTPVEDEPAFLAPVQPRGGEVVPGPRLASPQDPPRDLGLLAPASPAPVARADADAYAPPVAPVVESSRWGRWLRRTGAAAPTPVATANLTILVANPKGGAGKTPTAILLAAAFAKMQPGLVSVLDVNPRGTLGERIVRETEATFSDLAAHLGVLGRLPYLSDLDGLVQRQPDGWWAVPRRDSIMIQSDTGERPVLAPLLTSAEVDLVHAGVRANQRVTVIDSGNFDGMAEWQRAADLANVLVVPMEWDHDGGKLAAKMLRDLILADRGRLARAALVVGSWAPGKAPDPTTRRHYRRYFGDLGHALFEIPPDPEVVTGPISWDALRKGTQTAVLKVAEEAVSRQVVSVAEEAGGRR